MKSIYYLLVLVCMIFLFSCKEKISHDKALTYYVNVSLQVKEVISLVKEFSPQLLRYLKDSSAKKSISETDVFKQSYSDLFKQVNGRLIVLENLPAYNKETILKFWAVNYIKDTRKVLVGISSIINWNKTVSQSSKQKIVAGENLFFYKIILTSDASYLNKYSREYAKKYDLSTSELSKYALE